MRIGMSLKGINQTLRNLHDVSTIIPTDFKSTLIDQGKELRNRAREILEEKSQQRTSKRYWTGYLQESIKMIVGGVEPATLTPWGVRNIETGRWQTSLKISVGTGVKYAEWVEIGHYLVAGAFGQQRGEWWEGYHFLEGAYVEIAPKIAQKIKDTLSVSLNKFGRTASARTRHLVTGRFVPGFAIE